MSKQLIVSLRPDGSVAAETVGMHGDECLSYVSALEDLLEATAVQSAFTADYAGIDTRSENTHRITERDV